jgi:hypothetical protein
MTKVGVDDYIVKNRATAADLESLARVEFWPGLAPEALHGLAGRIVEAVDPYTEADPVATLVHVLTGVGNLVGAGPHARVQHDRHALRLNTVLVGRSGKGRKGTAWSAPRYLFSQVDEAWARHRVKTGLSTGEGLIYNVRDLQTEQKPIKERGRVVGSERVVVDEGEPDKRLLVIEPEFAVVLKNMARETNTLSGVIRQAWDSGDLSTLTRNKPLRATGAHISVIGHITEEELRRHLRETDRANGFANRFLWVLVRRSKVLPEGAAVPDAVLAPLVSELRDVLAFAEALEEVTRDEAARAAWAEVYPDLSEGHPGMLGAIISRAEAQVLRLSALYAVLDRSTSVRPAHLHAALAVWQYAEASARRIFGELLGSPMADVILEALSGRGPLAESEIHALFARNKTRAAIHGALDELRTAGKVRSRTERTDGRPAIVWEAR